MPQISPLSEAGQESCNLGGTEVAEGCCKFTVTLFLYSFQKLIK